MYRPIQSLLTTSSHLFFGDSDKKNKTKSHIMKKGTNNEVLFVEIILNSWQS